MVAQFLFVSRAKETAGSSESKEIPINVLVKGDLVLQKGSE